ncbi:MAG TPA: DUF1801 domain-containing protein [Flavobacteriaceae bacterium]|nr:DUF1801 domain-containing protein [Flavobacteriaceae bacterium]
MKKITSVEEYIEHNSHYGEALTILRNIILGTELEETIKWNSPVYALNGKNVVSIGAFKHHFGIWFYNGVFLKDEHNLLEQAQEKTKGLRNMKMTSVDQINKPVVLAYIKEAIENQKLGKEITPEKKGKTVDIPQELNTVLKQNKALLDSFKTLTPFKQREYCEYIETAKRDATKQTRLEKITPMILKSIGLNDKYRDC